MEQFQTEQFQTEQFQTELKRLLNIFNLTNIKRNVDDDQVASAEMGEILKKNYKPKKFSPPVIYQQIDFKENTNS